MIWRMVPGAMRLAYQRAAVAPLGGMGVVGVGREHAVRTASADRHHVSLQRRLDVMRSGRTTRVSTATIIAAAGSGTRLGGRPKQFLELVPGERIVDRVVSVARATTDWVGLVLPAGHEWTGVQVDAVTEGGASRYGSVRAGLERLPAETTTVVIHSASHPLASEELVRALVAAVEAGADGAVPLLEAVDVVKRRNVDGQLTTVGRDGIGTAQCPMAFRRDALDQAYATVTDGIEDSQMVEAAGGRVVAVRGEVTNLHVVDEASLAVVRALASWSRAVDVRSSGA